MVLAYINWEALPGLIFWIVFLILFIKFFMWLCSNKEDGKNPFLKENGYLRLPVGDYLGGFKDVAATVKDCYLDFYKDYFEIELTLSLNQIKIKNDEIIKSNNIRIDKKNFIEAEIISEKTLKEQLNLGKLLIFGIFAFGMKNTRTEINNYMLIKYMHENEVRTLVFDVGVLRLQCATRYLNAWKKDDEKIKNITYNEMNSL